MSDDLYKEALEYHRMDGVPGKLSVVPTKPLVTQRHLALAYSPGVAAACNLIYERPSAVYEYTSKANMVAVVSNGTAILGLGDLGPDAAKPVMEGKAVLFKRFANVNSINIEVYTKDIDEFINTVRYFGPGFGGINLEDIRSPDCFLIEARLKELLDVPVFHDDQHGTAIIVAAALINALDITRRSMKDIKMVMNGAGAAGIACIELLKLMGVPNDSILVCDQYGVIYKGREHNMNPWKERHAVHTKDRTLTDALCDADVFCGLSVKDALSPEMLKGMKKAPIIFAMANPDPEIKPELALSVRPDAIIATGRSDYPNQVNNVMGFPYIFRGALDVRASAINDDMKIAAAKAIAALAREPVHDDVYMAYSRSNMQYGPNYIIPVPFDPRLISTVAPAVARAAIDTGVARTKIEDWGGYAHSLDAMFNPSLNTFSILYESLKGSKKRVIFAEGEEEKIVKVAASLRDGGHVAPILVGNREKILAVMDAMGLTNREGITITNAALSDKNGLYIEHFYSKVQRFGKLHRDCVREVKNDRNIFASCMLDCGDGDALVTGLTRGYLESLRSVRSLIRNRGAMFGVSIIMAGGRTVFIADTSVNCELDSETMADIAISLSAKVVRMGCKPRVAFLSCASFGSARHNRNKIRGAIEILDNSDVDFEYDGEITADVALNKQLLSLYPFTRLTDAANILIMPSLDAANISYKLLRELGSETVFGPVLVGAEKSVQIISMGSSVTDIYNLAMWAAADTL